MHVCHSVVMHVWIHHVYICLCMYVFLSVCWCPAINIYQHVCKCMYIYASVCSRMCVSGFRACLCVHMFVLKHPNIVCFISIYYPKRHSDIPAMIMEQACVCIMYACVLNFMYVCPCIVSIHACVHACVYVQ